MRNFGSRLIREKFLRKTDWQKESKVEICAELKRIICFSSRAWVSSSKVSCRRSVKRIWIRERISCAAALVKVMINISSTSQEFSSIKFTTRSVRVLVFPAPAAAAVNKFSPRASIAACCSFVNSMIKISTRCAPIFREESELLHLYLPKSSAQNSTRYLFPRRSK